LSEPANPSIDDRKEGILKAVVVDYVTTAEPVGSHTLAARHHFGVRSATIRNELAELADMGYLRQPHTSSGRIPSDTGYRYYVDRLMDAVKLSRDAAARARDDLAARNSEVEMIIEQTCRILSRISRYTSLATRPTVKEATISYVSVARVGRRKLLAVTALDNGQVLHELLDLDGEDADIDPTTATNFLMSRLGGRTMERAMGDAVESVPSDSSEMTRLLGKMRRIIRREMEEDESADIHTEGTSYIMRQPEFKDVERLEAVMSVLEEGRSLARLFSSLRSAPQVTVIIGSENPLDEMRDCSFVGTRYRVRGRVAGTIGLLGPTRMDYPRAVSSVEFVARSLGELLTALGGV